MRRTDTAVVFPQPHPDSTTAAVLKKASKGKAKKLRAKGTWFKAASNVVIYLNVKQSDLFLAK